VDGRKDYLPAAKMDGVAPEQAQTKAAPGIKPLQNGSMFHG
jgi:hypothetical protein